MNNATLLGWTAWCGDLREEDKLNGKGEKYTKRSIWFKLAVKRRYKSVQRNEDGDIIFKNGDPVRDYNTDFFLCNATGKTAELIDRFVNVYEKVDGEDKIVSKKLLLEGAFEIYSADSYKRIFLKNVEGEIVECGEDTKEREIKAIVNYPQTTLKVSFFRIVGNKSDYKYKKKTSAAANVKGNDEEEVDTTDYSELDENVNDEFEDYEDMDELNDEDPPF